MLRATKSTLTAPAVTAAVARPPNNVGLLTLSLAIGRNHRKSSLATKFTAFGWTRMMLFAPSNGSQIC